MGSRIEALIVAVLAFGAAACGDRSNAASAPVADAPSDADHAISEGGVSPDTNVDAGATGSRCTITGDAITCKKSTTTIAGRTVAYAVPVGDAPAAGWPAVVFFQGSFVAGDSAFAATQSDTFGRYQLTLTIKALLNRGYVVVAPDASGGGNGFSQTNIPPYATSWPGCADDMLMQAFLASIASGAFGHVDTTHRYAMGISSGGFMTSRMAVS
jgi:poly(3-hydroxybutyrate) depolymerase